MIGDEEIPGAALRLWGEDAQVDHLIEEMAELTQALLHSRRAADKTNKYRTPEILEELADVLICIDQLKFIMCSEGFELDEALQDVMGAKLLRLKNRIGKNRIEGVGQSA